MIHIGINYYAVKNRPTVETPIHIGKSSWGWLFCFQTHNDAWRDVPVVWNTYEEVKDWLKKHTVDKNEYVIIDEDDEIISYLEFIDIIEDKQNDEYCITNPDNFVHSRNVNGYRFVDGDFS